MNPYQEMMNKTGVQVVGLLKSVNNYVPDDDKTKSYKSVDLDIQGSKNALTVSLPADADESKYHIGELCSLKLRVSVFNGKTRFTAF